MIEVQETPTAEGWTFEVDITNRDSRTHHRVTLRKADYERLTGGRVSPEVLVRESFAFLLEREPAESILTAFDLPVIGRYFPEYAREMERGFRA
jgi:hypothetical protein